MTTWADVGLALAGAPVGAGIAVIGVHLTNKANANALRQQGKDNLQALEKQGDVNLRTIQAQADADRTRTSHERRLEKRDDFYAKVMESCKDRLSSAHDARDTLLGIQRLRVESTLYASRAVNDALQSFAAASFGVEFTLVSNDELTTEQLSVRTGALEWAEMMRQRLVHEIRQDLGHQDT